MLQTLSERIDNSHGEIQGSASESTSMKITTNSMRINFRSNTSMGIVLNVLEVLKNP